MTQSSFASPCFRLTDLDGVTAVGLDSGFVPVAANATAFPSWTLTVLDAAPLWFFCRQSNHVCSHSSRDSRAKTDRPARRQCQLGMGFAINAPATGNTVAAFLAKAQGAVSIPVWTETATAKWAGAGIAGARPPLGGQHRGKC